MHIINSLSYNKGSGFQIIYEGVKLKEMLSPRFVPSTKGTEINMMKFKSEIFDELQFLFEVYKFNDHQLHCVIRFDGKIDRRLLEKAIILTLDVVPILGSKYVENCKQPYWQKVETSKHKNILMVVYNEQQFNRFITLKTDEFTGPEVRACLLSSYKDSLAIIMNHMICDAAGFKQYLYILSDLYSKLVKDHNYVPDYIINGDRGIKRINEKFSLKDKIKAIALQSKESNRTSSYKFPMSAGEDISPFILTHNISENRYLEIKEYCNKYNVTINDVVLAAYYRVLYNILKLNSNSALSIPIMVDMRRYLKNKNINAICNLTSIVTTNIKYNCKDSFKETVLMVNKEMENKKSRFLGLNGFLKISILFEAASYGFIKKIMKGSFKNPLIGMTNIGIIDDKRLVFEGAIIKDAFVCGSIKYPPYFQLALTSYRNSMTFSVNLYGDSKDKENIEHFFSLLDNELPK